MLKSICWALAPAISCLLLASGCYEDGSSELDGQDALDAPGDSGDGIREPLMCDAVYVPLVTFTFTDGSTGEAYCGPAEITYEVLGGGGTGTAQCECVENVMVHDVFGSMECHINPPEGETSRITVSVEGYEDFVTEVTLPYQCHPQAQVDVLLVPLEAPSGCDTMMVPGCGEGRLCVQTQPPYCTSEYLGYCMDMPDDCSAIPERIICACDSLTIYRNECEARRAGFGGLLIECP